MGTHEGSFSANGLCARSANHDLNPSSKGCVSTRPHPSGATATSGPRQIKLAPELLGLSEGPESETPTVPEGGRAEPKMA